MKSFGSSRSRHRNSYVPSMKVAFKVRLAVGFSSQQRWRLCIFLLMKAGGRSHRDARLLPRPHPVTRRTVVVGLTRRRSRLRIVITSRSPAQRLAKPRARAGTRRASSSKPQAGAGRANEAPRAPTSLVDLREEVQVVDALSSDGLPSSRIAISAPKSLRCLIALAKRLLAELCLVIRPPCGRTASRA
jgi:hypothetical protein